MGSATEPVKQIIRHFACHYPERVNKVFLINAPYFFTGLWASVKLFLDPAVVSKISISSSGRRELLDYVGAEKVPLAYGGSDPTPLGEAPEELALLEWVRRSRLGPEGHPGLATAAAPPGGGEAGGGGERGRGEVEEENGAEEDAEEGDRAPPPLSPTSALSAGSDDGGGGSPGSVRRMRKEWGVERLAMVKRAVLRLGSGLPRLPSQAAQATVVALCALWALLLFSAP